MYNNILKDTFKDMYSGRCHKEEMGKGGIGVRHDKCNNEGFPKRLISESFLSLYNHG